MSAEEHRERSPKERMLAGEPYLADDPELRADALRAAELVAAYNAAAPGADAERTRLLGELLGSLGDDVALRPPLRVDYGYQLHVGPRTFANFGLVALDVARIDIGADCQLGPNVQLLTPTHPVDPGPRRAKWEAAAPIRIGDNV